MKALLESKDLLAEPRVVAAARGFLGLDVPVMAGIIAPVTVPGSLADVAFAMRDAFGSNNLLWCKQLIDIETIVQMRDGIDGKANNAHVIRWSTPEHWVIAACAVWENKK